MAEQIVHVVAQNGIDFEASFLETNFCFEGDLHHVFNTDICQTA